MNKIKGRGSTLLSVFAVGGFVVTSILLIKETPKVRKKLDELEANVYNPTFIEKACVILPEVWPSLLTGAATVFCIFGSNYISRKQHAALMTIAMASDKALRKHKESIKAVLSDEQLDAIESHMAEEDYKEQIPIAISGQELFYEAWSDRFFYSDEKSVLEAMYHFNRNFTLAGERCVNEYFEFLGLSSQEKWNKYGFNSTEFLESGLMPWIDFYIREKELKDGTKYKAIDFQWDPTFDFENYGIDG